MAEPARRSPAGLDAPGWVDIRHLIAVTLQAVPKVVDGYLASGCDDTSPAAHMLGVVTGVLQALDEAIRNVDIGQAAIDERCAQAVAEDRAAWPRGRGHLRIAR